MSEAQAVIKYNRISAKKLREVARTIQGEKASRALDLLKLIPRKAARLLFKALTSAVANAENNHNMSSDALVVKRALVEQGPSFRRFRPAARGSAHPYRKHTSHIRVVLADESSNS